MQKLPLLVAFAASLVAACAADATQTASETADVSKSHGIGDGDGPGLALSVHTTLGIPEAATADDPKHSLLVKPEYVVSFDSTRKNPRWTAWSLVRANLGTTARAPGFLQDPSLPSTMGQADNSDYDRSGYDRGHLCPSGDRTDNVADNTSTFVFTNAVPQTDESNTGTWETLEYYERGLANEGHHLFIVAGSRYETEQTIGAGVSVPTSMFKVIAVLDGASPTPADVTATTRIISVDIPNTHDVKGDWTNYRTTFGQLETETGLKFLADVPGPIHDVLAKYMDNIAPIPKPN